MGQGGIVFDHGTWQEAKQKATKENKLIFVDFFTEWCGPCLGMAEEIFPQMEVGNLYNARFVNLKIDAEKGEGLTLKDRYAIGSYPTYLFIDPQTEEIVHRSSSRQDAATFIFTGQSALNPKMRSPYLEKEYASGNRDRELLLAYMDYLASVYRRDELQKVLAEYTGRKDFALTDSADWNVFVKHINGVDNPQMREVLANKSNFDSQYGIAVVDTKLFKEFNLVMDTKVLQSAPQFRGKDFLLQKNTAETFVRAKEYEKAASVISGLMENPGEFKEELCVYLKFVARSILYGEHTDFWIKQCAGYAQYVAYNTYNRQEPMIHYDYAVILEKLIRRIPDAEKYFPESIVKEPEDRMKGYSMRSPKLKFKPSRSKK